MFRLDEVRRLTISMICLTGLLLFPSLSQGAQESEMQHRGSFTFGLVESSVPVGWTGGYVGTSDVRLRPDDTRTFVFDLSMLTVPRTADRPDIPIAPLPFLEHLKIVGSNGGSVRSLDADRAIGSYDYFTGADGYVVRNRTWHLALRGPSNVMYIVTGTASEPVATRDTSFTPRYIRDAEGVLLQARILGPAPA
jgi:hypothetical protein